MLSLGYLLALVPYSEKCSTKICKESCAGKHLMPCRQQQLGGHGTQSDTPSRQLLLGWHQKQQLDGYRAGVSRRSQQQLDQEACRHLHCTLGACHWLDGAGVGGAQENRCQQQGSCQGIDASRALPAYRAVPRNVSVSTRAAVAAEHARRQALPCFRSWGDASNPSRAAGPKQQQCHQSRPTEGRFL